MNKGTNTDDNKFNTFPECGYIHYSNRSESSSSLTCYEDYLSSLQERNRTRRKLKKKSQKQLALERREKGFTLYLNGANAEKEKILSPVICRKSKDIEVSPRREFNSIGNASSSPRTSRKNWMVQNLNIKTQDGSNLKIFAPNTDSTSSSSCKSSDSNSGSTENIYIEEFSEENESEIEEIIESSSDSNCGECIKSISTPEISQSSDIAASNWWHNRQNNLKSFSQHFSTIEKEIIMDDESDIIELQSTPKRLNRRLSSACYINSNDSPSIQSGVVKDVLQAIQAENQSIEKKYQQNANRSTNPSNFSHLKSPRSKTEMTSTVTIEILSNWGHPNRVGLTEVQFFDKDQKLILIEEVKVIGAFEPKGELSNLHNQKMRTVKERYMWSCALRCDPIQLEFILSPVSQKPSLIKIWNFNHSIKDLLIGARQIRIRVNSEIVFDGILDKGCGNQVFDYSHSIRLSNDGLAPSSPSVIQPVKSIVDENMNGANDSEKTELFDGNSFRSLSVMESQVPHAKKELFERRTQSGLNLVRNDNTNMDLSIGSITSLNNPLSPTRMKSSISLHNYQTTKPKWLDMYPKDDNLSNKKPSWLHGLDINLKEPLLEPVGINSRCGSGTSLSGRPLRYDSESQLHLHSFDDDDSTKPLLFSNDDSKPSRENSAKYGRRAIPSPIPSSGDPRRRAQLNSGHNFGDGQREESARVRSGRNFDRTLEESWTSLHMFDQCHRGRLSINMEGDVLDTYLNSNKLKAQAICSDNELDSSTFENSNTGFIIPELPEGINLTVNIKTTWGDRHYVGLNGIEFFASSGEAVKVKKITANPADINILPEYSKDPRVVSNLIDGIHRTKDDMHLWLTPFSRGSDHSIFMTLEKHVKIAMIRIWNYNKSRIHSFRGAKDIEITLDHKCIFKGEIARACGGIQGGIEAFGDTILFTTDEDILESIAKHDETFSYYTSITTETVKEDILFERPRTGYLLAEGERPMTSAETNTGKNIRNWEEQLQDVESISYSGDVLELNAISNWGDPSVIGLTGLEIMDENGDVISISSSNLSTNINDPKAAKTLSKLIDGNNVSTSDNHMWSINYLDGKDHKIVIKFKKQVQISGIRVWNYNRSLEDSYRGVRHLHITLNGKLLSPVEGFLIRKGPGNCHFDFAQEVRFVGPPAFSLIMPNTSRSSDKYSYDNVFTQDYESPVMPRGFVFQLQLYSTWGDPYYVGLNGLEFYDAVGNLIPLSENNIAAYPDSVNVLDNVENDVRTPDKLIDGVNDTMDGHHMWLAPVLPCVMNRVYIVFDYPVTVSMIKLWNYAKTPARCVKEFGLLVDDLLVYHNTLNQIPPETTTKKLISIPHHTILFTADKEITQQEKNSVLRVNNLDQDVQLTNDCQVVHRGTSGKVVDQALRPMTSLPPSK